MCRPDRLAQLSHGRRRRTRRERARSLRIWRRRAHSGAGRGVGGPARRRAHPRARRVYAFPRAGDEAAQAFAKSLGAVWAGVSDETPPEPLDAAIIFAPVGALVPAALKAVKKGGRVVCGGIHMSDIPSFPYRLL